MLGWEAVLSFGKPCHSYQDLRITFNSNTIQAFKRHFQLFFSDNKKKLNLLIKGVIGPINKQLTVGCALGIYKSSIVILGKGRLKCRANGLNKAQRTFVFNETDTNDN